MALPPKTFVPGVHDRTEGRWSMLVVCKKPRNSSIHRQGAHPSAKQADQRLGRPCQPQELPEQRQAFPRRIQKRLVEGNHSA